MTKHRPYIVLLIVTVLFYCCQAWCEAALATSPSTSPLKKIEHYKNKMLLLQGDIAVQKGMVKEVEQKAKHILAEIEELDTKLHQHKMRLQTLLDKAIIQKQRIAKQEEKLKQLEKEREEASIHLQKRGAAFYTMGSIGLFNATFSSKSIPDLITLKNSFATLLQYDKKVLIAYEKTLETGKQAQRALQLENMMLVELIKQAKIEKQQVAFAKEERLTRLAEIRNQKELRQQAIKELDMASEKLSSSIAKIKNDVVQQQTKFSDSKKTLPMPIQDGVIATRFHQMTTNTFGEETSCNGIEITSPNGTAVIAAGDGKVFFADYLQGYGNTIIINHGMHYHTILSRLEEIYVKKGEKVKQGEKIALAGDSATLFSKGVYFEIRKKQQQLDPLEWLAPEQLQFAEPQNN